MNGEFDDWTKEAMQEPIESTDNTRMMFLNKQFIDYFNSHLFCVWVHAGGFSKKK